MPSQRPGPIPWVARSSERHLLQTNLLVSGLGLELPPRPLLSKPSHLLASKENHLLGSLLPLLSITLLSLRVASNSPLDL